MRIVRRSAWETHWNWLEFPGFTASIANVWPEINARLCDAWYYRPAYARPLAGAKLPSRLNFAIPAR
jgi:hypothetical protein